MEKAKYLSQMIHIDLEKDIRPITVQLPSASSKLILRQA
jgi:hypothetical protein